MNDPIRSEARRTTADRDEGRAEDRALLAEAVKAAGALALEHLARGVGSVAKHDGSPVSEADLAVDALLRERLVGRRAGYGWLSEETADTPDRLACRRVWVVDPIDGTRSFIKREPEWSISAALVEDGRPVLAAVFAPALDLLFEAEVGRGAERNGQPIEASRRDELAGSRLLISKKALDRTSRPAPWPRIVSRFVSSIALRLALVADGKDADGTVGLPVLREWDIAAGVLLVEEAGGRVATLAGDAIAFNKPEPLIGGLIASGAGLHAPLLAQVAGLAAEIAGAR